MKIKVGEKNNSTLIKRFEEELIKANAEIETLWKVINKLMEKDGKW